MGIKVANNAFGTLAASLSDVATTLSVNAGEGARFPTLGAGDYFFLTLIDTANNIEIVKVTARSSDSMTIVRGQDGTTAKSYAVNDRVELRPTAALFDEKADVTYVNDELDDKLDYVAPGTSGNVLTSNGTTWTSAALPAGGVTSFNGQTGAVVANTFNGINSHCTAVRSTAGTVGINTTVAGSTLQAINLAGSYYTVGLTGTWRNLGGSVIGTTTGASNWTVMVRIS